MKSYVKIFRRQRRLSFTKTTHILIIPDSNRIWWVTLLQLFSLKSKKNEQPENWIKISGI
jgi:hypothetical protein